MTTNLKLQAQQNKHFCCSLVWVYILSGLAFCACSVSSFSPGYLSHDSIIQYAQGHLQFLQNAHPPLLAWIWGHLEKLFPGPLAMLLLLNALYWAGLTGYCFFTFAGRWRGLLALGILGLYPAYFIFLGMLWKDVLLGASLLFSLGCISALKHRLSWASRLFFAALAVLGLFLATTARHNGFCAVAPLCVYFVYALKPHFSRLRLVLAGSLVFFAIYLLAATTEEQILKSSLPPDSPAAKQYEEVMSYIKLPQLRITSRQHMAQLSLLFDLASLSLQLNTLLLPPSFLSEKVTLASLAQEARQGSLAHVFFLPEPAERLYPSDSAAEIEQLRRAWVAAVIAHPWEWLKVRLTVVRPLLGLNSKPVFSVIRETDPNPFGFQVPKQGFNRLGRWLIATFSQHFLLHPWFYLLFLSVAFCLALTRVALDGNSSPEILAIAGSGLANALPIFLCAISPDVRYLWWSLITAGLCLTRLMSDSSLD